MIAYLQPRKTERELIFLEGREEMSNGRRSTRAHDQYEKPMNVCLHNVIPRSFIHLVDFPSRLRTSRASVVDHPTAFRAFSLKEPLCQCKASESAEHLHVQPSSHLNRFLYQHLHIRRYRDIGLEIYCFSFSVTLANQLMGGDSGFIDAPSPAR